MHSNDSLFDLRRQLADPARLVQQLGLADGALREPGGVKVRCPAHVERSPSCSVRVGRDGTIATHCFGCGLDGNVFHLVAAVHRLDANRDFLRVVELAAELAGTTLAALTSAPARPPAARAPTAPPPPARPPREQLRALWEASVPVNATQVNPPPEDLAVSFLFARRRWWPGDVAALGCVRVLPLEHAWPTWWPASWARSWRLALLAFEPHGVVGSIHARAIDDAAPKTRWPYKCDAKGLLFADARGRALLQGKPVPDLAGVVVTEGVTDFIAAAASMVATGARYATIGGTSGSWGALAHVRWPAGVILVIATDHDEAGERYAGEIARATPEHVRLRRWNPPAAPAQGAA